MLPPSRACICRVDPGIITNSPLILYFSRGVGALYVRKGTELAPIIFGGGQERGLRSATENVAGIVGFGAAAEIARKELDQEAKRLAGFRQEQR